MYSYRNEGVSGVRASCPPYLERPCAVQLRLDGTQTPWSQRATGVGIITNHVPLWSLYQYARITLPVEDYSSVHLRS